MSIVFDPDDLSVPVMKFPLKDAVALNPHGNKNAFTLTTTSFMSMKPNNLDVPYKCVRHPSGGADWVFSFVYANLESVLPLLHEALFLSQQSRHELNQMLRERQLRKLAGKGNTFDTAMYLRDAINEKVLINLPCILRAPLVHSPGRLAITTECIYFQPLHDIEGNSPCKIHQIKDVVLCCKKKFKLQESIALELLFWKPKNPSAPRWETSSAFFVFQSPEECSQTWEAIVFHKQVGVDTPLGQDGTKIACKIFADALDSAKGSTDALRNNSSLGNTFLLEKATWCWQKHLVSNFHYLMFLNLLSGRTFNDLSQWPVMPWVLKDYTSSALDINDAAAFRDLSKPIGALNEDRLGMLKERFSLMPDDDPRNPPFLYGTHYSNPGYVMYWLVRAAPGHLLRLQSGRFDAPDRMFHSMQESWSSVLTNPADVKELIPEFFVRDLAVKFLQANEALPLGNRQNGKSIDEVELPPWADSPLDFVLKHRSALDDGRYVNENLHNWIDLIWGCKQRGAEAIKADNVFHGLTYATGEDLDKIDDEMHREAVEQQAQEFGQTPNQLFFKPHRVKAAASQHKNKTLVTEESDASCVVDVVRSILDHCKDNLDDELHIFVPGESGHKRQASKPKAKKQTNVNSDLGGLRLDKEDIQETPKDFSSSAGSKLAAFFSTSTGSKLASPFSFRRSVKK